MKKDEIVVGGVYSNGKNGVRRVLDAGPQYKLYPEQEETDCVLYEVLEGRHPHHPNAYTETGKPLYHSTRASFASWAKVRLQ